MKDKLKQYLPFILVNAATATLTTLGTEVVKWGVEAIKDKVSPKKEEKKEQP